MEKNNGSELAEQCGSGRKQRKSHVVLIFVLLLLLAAGGGAAVYYLLNPAADEDLNIPEAEAWQNVSRWMYADEPDSLAYALDIYQRSNPEGQHIGEVEKLQERLEKEADEWEKVMRNNCTPESVDAFLSYHPEGFFHRKAMLVLDSLTFAAAVEEETEEAILEYMEQYPNGAFMKEAQKLLDSWGNLEMDPAEEEEAVDVVITHFRALGDGDEDALLSTTARSLSSYLGKKGATAEDVTSYMQHVCSKGGSRWFEVRERHVKKVKNADSWVYNVQFRLNETITLGDSTSSDTKYFDGTAIVAGSDRDDMRITSLVLQKSEGQVSE